MKTIRAEVREADDRLVAELAIIENLQRKDLNPIEKAMSFKRYIDEHKCKQDDLARRLSIDRSTIANLMRLLELPQQILDWLAANEITAGHARALLPIGDDEIQVRTAAKIMDERWSVRATETHVAEMLKAEEDAETGKKVVNATRQKRRQISPQIESLQQEMRMIFGTKVEIKCSARSRGKITIHFHGRGRIRPPAADAMRCCPTTTQSGRLKPAPSVENRGFTNRVPRRLVSSLLAATRFHPRRTVASPIPHCLAPGSTFTVGKDFLSRVTTARCTSLHDPSAAIKLCHSCGSE